MLRPVGRLDADSCGELRVQLGTAFAAGVRSVVVDLSEVTAVDPTGLGVLAGAARHLRSRGGGLAVTNASPGVVTSMRINGTADLLQISASPGLRVVPGAGRGGTQPRARGLAAVPDGGLKQPS